MPTTPTNAASSTASAQTGGGTALRGRIEAIGIFDLLRIGVTKCSTGRLLVFNDSFDAELYYLDGRLLAVKADSGSGADALKRVLEMSEGEFEFTYGIELPAADQDSKIHDAMTAAIKTHYQERVRARQESNSDQTPFVRTSGVHRVVSDPSVEISPIVNLEQPAQSSASTGTAVTSDSARLDAPRLLPCERGRATTDSAGRASAKLGVVTPQEAALVALAAKQAQTLATILGMRELQRFEITAANERALLCRVVKDSIRFSATSDGVDVENIWLELES